MHTYKHVVDQNGAHWLQAYDKRSYFNGVAWIKAQNTRGELIVVGELSIQDFLVVLATNLDYDFAL